MHWVVESTVEFPRARGVVCCRHEREGGIIINGCGQAAAWSGFMEYNDNLAALVDQVKQASVNLDANDTRINKRIGQLEKSINELYIKQQRPGSSWNTTDDELTDRKSAIELCRIRRNLTIPKTTDGSSVEYVPSSSEIDEALVARKAIRSVFRTGNTTALEPLERKSLSSFSFGTNQFILAPEISDLVISCIVDPTDIAGLVGQATTSAGSVKFLIDNVRMQIANWACDAACWSNNPAPDLAEGLGTMEVRSESLRFVVCVTNELLEDASFPIESWIMRKAAAGFRNAISAAILTGDGVGRPLGMLNPRSGIPVVEVGAATQIGQFSWQDLIQLMFEIPNQFWPGAAFYMNQRTLGLLISMADANHRPIFAPLVSGMPSWQFAGAPIHIVSQMPDVAAGSTPILFGNLRETYLLITRKALTMQPDQYTAAWCTLMKFETRCGGALICPNASRLLRIR
jgi:HK97 family phage major capsid protein